MKRGEPGRKSPPKQSLNLPDLDQARSAVLNIVCRYPFWDGEFIACYCSDGDSKNVSRVRLFSLRASIDWIS